MDTQEVKSTRLRSLVKAITWETSGILTFALIGVLLGNWAETLRLGLVYFPAHTAMYFGHERIWKRIRWGHRPEKVVFYYSGCPICQPPDPGLHNLLKMP